MDKTSVLHTEDLWNRTPLSPPNMNIYSLLLYLLINIMTYFLFFIFLVFHLIGDVALQTKSQDLDKSINKWKLIEHVSVYTITLTLLLIVFQIFKLHSLWDTGVSAYVKIIIFSLITFITHYFVDLTTSRYIDYYWFTNAKYDFFYMVIVDQFIHYLTLYSTIYLLYFY